MTEDNQVVEVPEDERWHLLIPDPAIDGLVSCLLCSRRWTFWPQDEACDGWARTKPLPRIT